ncbi:uncharacterized protein LOC132034693 [Lycium ferocissimum]|uniref:uncharacterized protein LOC132034693 n=1 Tax=Lycium ferocissimum TaxID=112874 RepID=UPI00281673F1|nr:uncharacterized protein LOC132034693 [Lycium ferocissimum]
MSNLSKLEFVALDISGKNYLSWVLNVEIHLDSKGLGATITQGNTSSSQDKAKTMIFLRHHLDEGLKVEYLTVKDPLELWAGLKEKYDHIKVTVLPRARYEWIHLRLQDFKTVCDYNSTVYRITSQLKLRGDNITDEACVKRGFKKHADLISCLLVAEQHNTLLLKNHEARPTGTGPFPEPNVVAKTWPTERRQNNRGHNNERGCGKGKGRYNNRRDGGHHKRENNMGYQGNPSRSNCHRCGLQGQRKNECRSHEMVAVLYQNSFKRKANRGGASSRLMPGGVTHDFKE